MIGHYHVAILREPYLSLILNGKKTIESRFTKRRTAPFNKVSVNDLIYLKKSGGSILGTASVQSVQFFSNLNPQDISQIMNQYKAELQIQPDFMELKRDSNYASLIWLKNVKRMQPIQFKKNNQLPWVLLEDRLGNQQ